MRVTPTESATSMTSLPAGRADAYPHAADLALIPFAIGSDRGAAHFVLTPDLTRHDGALYGGTGAAAAVMMMEAATQRDAVWVATQFVAQARIGERIDLVAHVLAEGKRIAQVHVVATVDDRIIFTALGATAHPRPHGLTGQYDDMPRVTPPERQRAAPSGPGPVGAGRARLQPQPRVPRGDVRRAATARDGAVGAAHGSGTRR